MQYFVAKVQPAPTTAGKLETELNKTVQALQLSEGGTIRVVQVIHHTPDTGKPYALIVLEKQ